MSLRLDRLPPLPTVPGTWQAFVQWFFSFYSSLQIWWQKQAKATEDHEDIQDALIDGLEATDDAVLLLTDELTQNQIDLAEAQADLEDTVDDLAAAQAEIDDNTGSLADHETRIDAIEAAAATYVLKNQTAAWGAATGTETRTALAAYTGQTVSNPPTQAEVQALDNYVRDMSQRLVALINDGRAVDLLTE